MRFFIVALMIALLPLRGWAGEVMATEMASNQVVQAHKQAEYDTEIGATGARIHWVKGIFNSENSGFQVKNPLVDAGDARTSAMQDCDGHAKAVEADLAHTHCETCPACQACHTVALSTAVGSFNPTFAARTLQWPVAAGFASAITARGQKPPIS